MIILFGFMILGLRTFGLLGSYSQYASKWTEAVPLNNIHLWSLVTFIAAFLLMPVMIELGEGNPLQCLGFFAPVYLMIVSLTPEFQVKPVQRKIHTWGASLCAVMAFAWMIFIQHAYVPVSLSFLLALLGGYATKSLVSSKIWWGEIFMFLGVYLTILM